jgi:hypothetical protein
MVLLEPRREPHQPDLPISLLGGAIAGTFTAGVNAAGPTWVPLPLGIAAPMLVGFLFPGAGTWQLVAGLLLVPMIAAFVMGEWLWLVLLTLPVTAGFTFLLVRIGQRWRAPRPAVDPEARGRQIRLAIIVVVAAAVVVPGIIADMRMNRDANARAQMAAERLRHALDRVEPGTVSPWEFPEVLREPGLPQLRAGQIGTTEVRVTAEVSAGWQRRCIRGVREKGTPATVEILPNGCGSNS